MVLINTGRDRPNAGIQVPVLGAIIIEVRELVERCGLDLGGLTLQVEDLSRLVAGILSKRHRYLRLRGLSPSCSIPGGSPMDWAAITEGEP